VHKYLEMLIISLIAIFAPIQALILTTGVLVILDLIVGVMSASKQGEKITSSGLRRTVSKLLIYETAIMLGFLVEIYMTGGLIPISRIAGTMIGITELKSIMESLDSLNGSPLLATLISKLGSKNEPPVE
jgi:holin family protein